MRAAALCLLLAWAGTALAGAWSNLWSTPEQQGQRLLDSKQAAAAAPFFKDPRRRGYAELRAGQYAQAAKSLAPLHDADSLYNRGNALAHTGRLSAALTAYDAALKQSPADGDITHNRDLVARALQKQQQRQGAKNPHGSGSGSGNQHGSADGEQAGTSGQQGAGGGQQAGTGGQQAATAGQQAAGGGQQAGTRSQQAGTAGQQGAGGGQQAGTRSQQAGTAGQQAAGGGQQAGTGGQQVAPGGQEAGAGGQQPGDSAQPQPRNGVSADSRGTSKSAAPQAKGTAVGDSRSARGTQPPPPPRSEQSLALDQWLRGIPDDSGELLRRKFLIEHMMKQQGNPP